MTQPKRWHGLLALCSLLAAISLALSGCGGSSSSSSSSSGSGSGPTPSTTANKVAVEVNSGPAGNYTNGIFASVTVCVPGTSTCHTIPNVLVDSGSEGLRLLSSAVTISLPAITDSSSPPNPLQECVVYGDGSYNWGTVVAADIKMAGEIGSTVPLQLIDSSNSTSIPNACLSGGGPNENTVQSLGANGILGIGIYQQDCGYNCTSASPSVPSQYWLCPNSSCSVVTVPQNFQVQNPVWTFPQDNNGVLLSLPSIPDTGAPSASGSLIFGISTQSDNAIGSATIYVPNSSGNITATYQNFQYPSFVDSGSNGLFFLDSAILGIPDCTDNSNWYCPGSTQSYTVTTAGPGSTATGSVTLNIANADALFAANGGQNWAFNNLGGDSGTSQSSDYVDFGLPFFFGRNVFVGIENQAGPNGSVGPYWAF